MSRTSVTRIVSIAFAVVGLTAAIWHVTSTDRFPLAAQPHPDSSEYADGAYQIANGNGFRTVVEDLLPSDQQIDDGQLHPSRYPPGFPLVLSVFVELGSNELSDTQTGTRAIAVGLVLTLFLAAWLLAGPVAAGLAAWSARLSPFVERFATMVMSDAFGALLAMTALVAVLLLRRRLPDRLHALLPAVAGFAAGFAVLTRLSAAVTLGAVMLGLTSWRQRRVLAAGAMVPLVFLGAYQWTEFGHPLRTGYDYYLPTLQEFDGVYITENDPFTEGDYITPDRLDGALMRWTCPCDGGTPIGEASNAVFYPAVLLGAYWIIAPPLLPLFGIWELVRRRRERASWVAAAIVVGHLVLFLPYFYQGARLVAPAAWVLLVYGCAGATNASRLVFARVSSRRRDAAETEPPASKTVSVAQSADAAEPPVPST